jgi:hypothetical protein
MQLAGLLGTFSAPLIYGWISGYVLAVGGVINLTGLALAAPVLRREWRRVSTSGEQLSQKELVALSDTARPDAAAQPPFAID